MSVHDFIKREIYSKKFNRYQVYLLSASSFIFVIGILVMIVTFGTIQQGKTQAKAEANPKPKYDPVVVSQQMMHGLDTNLLVNASYDTKSQTIEIISSELVSGEIFLPQSTVVENANDYYSFKLKVKDNNQKVKSETWLNYKKSETETDKNSGKVKLHFVVTDGENSQIEFSGRDGKNLINKPFKELHKQNNNN